MSRPELPFETLIQQLHGTDWTARCDAARLLGQSRDPRAVDALLPDLADPDWRVRRNAAQALGALRDPRAVEALLRALEDRTMTVRQRAVVALGRIRDVRALPALLEVLLQEGRASYEAKQAIRKFGKRALPDLVQAFERTDNQQLMLLLIEMKYEGAFDLLLHRMKSSEPPMQGTAIREMGKLADRRAIPYLIPFLESDDPVSQVEAIRALGSLGAAETVPLLLSLLADDELYGPRSAIYHAVTEACQMLGDLTAEIKNAFPGTYPALFSVGGAPISLPEAMGLLGDSPSDVLTEALARLQSGAAVQAEVPDIPPEVIGKVSEAMAWKFGVMFADARDASQERVRRLVDLLEAESSLQRTAAALTLPWYSDEASLGALEQAARHPDETLRIAATWASRALRKVILYRKQRGP